MFYEFAYRRGPRVSIVLALVLIGGGSVFWNLTARGAYETAEYQVVEKEGLLEVREYPDLTLVTTPMVSSSQGNDGSFMRLFRYISGANQEQQKVEMTTPVFMEEGTRESRGQMGFVVPKLVAEAGAPAPSGQDVRLQTRRGGRFAVIRFSGRMNQTSIEKANRELRDWMTKKGLKGAENYETAGYDAPWTPGFFRRNEVLIRLEDANKADAN